MTDDTLSRRARELLIAAHKAHPNYRPRQPSDNGVELNCYIVEQLEAGRVTNRAALTAIEAALRLSAGEDDMALVPRHYAENVNYAAAVLEQSRSVIDRNEAPVLRKVALLIAAPRHETGE